jgi:hypothetical protein
MDVDLLSIAAFSVLGAGFVAGYATRAWISARHRRVARVARHS